jgi:hypothetical protein
MKRLVILLPVLLAFQVGVQPAFAWTWPADGPVLRPFNVGDDPYAAGQHRGIDIGAPTGTSVRAPAGGAVSFAGTVPTGGRTLTIQTPDGYSVTLVHLGTIGVARGADVAEGSAIGTVGPSGEPEVGEPYVHLGIRRTADPNGYLDPIGFLPLRPGAPEPVPPAPEVKPAPAPAPVVAEPPATPPAPETQSEPQSSRKPGTIRVARAHAPSTQSTRLHPGVEGSTPEAGPTASRAERRRAAQGMNSAPRSVVLPVREVRSSFERTAPAASPRRGLGWPGNPGRPWLWALLTAVLAAAGASALVLGRQLVDAGSANGAPSILLEPAFSPAEDTGELRLGEEDGLVLDGDLEGILLAEPEPLADLDRDHDPAELIHVPDDPCRGRSARRAGRRSDRLLRAHRLRCPLLRAHA